MSEAVSEIKSCEQFDKPQRLLPRTVAELITRLEEAGKTMMALRGSGFSPRLAEQRYEIVRNPRTDYPGAGRMQAAAPDHGDIVRMDEALAWILWIPEQKAAVRRVVHSRCLIHPLTDRYMFSWRKIGETIGVDHKGVKRMYNEGIEIIFNRGFTNAPK